MRYKLFGRSGLRVSELALGTMTFGPEWGWGADKETSKALFDLYADAGGNFIDTANRYTEGTAEKYVGEFVAADREHFVVASKYTLKIRDGDPNFGGNQRKNMMQSLHASLKRLNTDYLDILWLHAWDFTTPVEEVLRGLDDLVRQGTVLYVGISDTPAWVVSQANTIADLRGWSRFVGLQIRYSLADRTAERDLLPMAQRAGHRRDAVERAGRGRADRQVQRRSAGQRPGGALGSRRARSGHRRRGAGRGRRDRLSRPRRLPSPGC